MKLHLQAALIVLSIPLCCPAFSQTNDSPEWRSVSLSKEDTNGSSALLALVRNSSSFARWIKGTPLGDNVLVGIEKAPESAHNSERVMKGAVVRDRLTATRYIIAELSNNDEPARIMLINEQTKATTTMKGTRILTASTSFTYPSISVDRDAPSSKRYIDALKELKKHADDCVTRADRSKLCRASDAAVALIRGASRHADALAAKLSAIKRDRTLAIDTTSAKSVTFEESRDGSRLRNVTLYGFIRSRAEKLVAPDATSSLTITMANDPDRTALNIRIVRPGREPPVKIRNLDFTFDQ